MTGASSTSPPRETLLHVLDRMPELGDRRAVGVRREYGLRWCRYSQLYRLALRAAELLRIAGVGQGDRVVLWGQSTPEWVACLFGVVARGAVVVPVDDGAPPETVARMAGAVSARHVVLPAGRAVPGQLDALTFESVHDPGEEVAREKVPEILPDHPAVIFFTSGTTATPRGVVLTHGNLMSQVARFRGWRRLVRRVPFRMLVSAPLSHVQGLMLGVCVPLSVGLSVFFTPLSHPLHLLRTIRHNRVTLLSTVPRVLQLLARTLEARPYGRDGRPLGEKLRSTRNRFLRRHWAWLSTRPLFGYRFWVVVVGGATLAEEVERFWRSTGCLFVQGYGLTETAAIVSVNAPLLGRFGSVGAPLAHQDVRLADDGEILVRGPNVTAGYFAGGAPPTTEDGYLRTGDLGRFDKRRRLFFTGRKKDVVVTAEGFNVYPDDVERALESQPGVRAAVVVGLDRGEGPEVHAALLLEPGASASEAVRAAASALAPHERVRGWTVWPEEDFPRGGLMKVQRSAVAAAIEVRSRTGAAPAPESAVTLQEILDTRDRDGRLRLLARYLTAPSRAEAGDRDLRLVDDLGLGSLDMVELLSRIEQRSGRATADLMLQEHASLAEVRDALARPASDGAQRPLAARDPPRWASAGLLALARRVFNPLVLLTWMKLRARLEVHGAEHLRRLRGPCVLSIAGHEHASDVITLYAALPPRLRGRLAFVASRWVFREYLDQGLQVSRATRALVGLGFNLLVPLFFPFALTPHFGTTREGLLEACRLLDRDYSLIVFGGNGAPLLGSQTGVPIVRASIEGNADVNFLPRWPRPRIVVRFERPIECGPQVSMEEIAAQLAEPPGRSLA